MNVEYYLERFHHAAVRGSLILLTAGALAAAGELQAWGGESSDIVYAESNSPAGNAILSFKNDGSGRLTFLNSTPAGGTGVYDPSFALGPFDSDQNLLVSRKRSLLFAVNSGSNSIAAFQIRSDGSLIAVSGSPFPSGGSNPVSVGLLDDTLVVVNKAQDPNQSTNQTLPNYTTFHVDHGGALDPVDHSTVPVAYGSSPSQALIASQGPFVFGADFQAGLLQSFVLGEEGRLHQNPPRAIPDSVYEGVGAPHFPLGLRTHPWLPILYVDLVTVNKVAVFQYSDRGGLSFARTVDDSGKGPCWAIVNHSGTRLYAINTGDNSVAVYDLRDPWKPKELQHFVMADTTGNPFSAVIDDSDRFIYVSSEVGSASATPSANAIHTLKVSADGTLTEPFGPTVLPINGVARAQGVAVFSGK
jgi:6-phosphogluconolactonase (cycloisomerase 2 family)